MPDAARRGGTARGRGKGKRKEKGRSGEEEILLGGGGLVRSKFDGDGWRAEEGEGDD